jgi:hypothetical protein
MCQQCEQLQLQIDKFRRALTQRFDPLTESRLKSGLTELEVQKASLHPEQRK